MYVNPQMTDQMSDLTCLYQINVQAHSLGTQILTNDRIYVPNENIFYNNCVLKDIWDLFHFESLMDKFCSVNLEIALCIA